LDIRPNQPPLPGDPENFRGVAGFPGYMASRSGDIWTCLAGRWGMGRGFALAWKKLTPHYTNGRPRVYLYREGSRTRRQVAHLILEAFIGPMPSGMECLHADDNPRNSSLANLRWGTKLENEREKTIKGRRPTGENSGTAKLTEDQVREIKQKLAGGAKTTHLAREYGVSQGSIWFIKSGHRWKDVGA
jgi:hypothetical protein